MKCSMCSVEVQSGQKVLVVTKDGEALVLRWSCEHFPVDEKDSNIVAILASMHCRNLWFGDYSRRVHDCSGHKARAS
jgi:hypothetical protein